MGARELRGAGTVVNFPSSVDDVAAVVKKERIKRCSKKCKETRDEELARGKTSDGKLARANGTKTGNDSLPHLFPLRLLSPPSSPSSTSSLSSLSSLSSPSASPSPPSIAM